MSGKGGERVIYGAGPVRELVRARPRDVLRVCVFKPGPVSEEAAAAGVRVMQLGREEIDRMAGEGAVHQGVVAVTGPYRYAEVEDIAEAAADGPLLVVALDSVSDPHNLGAVVRSAHLAGAHGVIVPKDRAAHVGATVTKASAGATELVRIAQVTNLARALEQLKEAGVWWAALHSAPGSIPLWKLDATGPMGLVLGSEGAGIRQLVAKQCDFAVEIPMTGRGVGSFNVSVAAGIALYEITRQRSAT